MFSIAFRYYQRKSREFHEKKGKEEGVTTLESGVQYKVLNKGTGKTHPGLTYGLPQVAPSPIPVLTLLFFVRDQVKVHYAGTLIDGKEFDSSYSRGEPASFGVNQVISGLLCSYLYQITHIQTFMITSLLLILC